MSDRYEPKLSVRSPGERKAGDAPPGDDPLAELARIVSGRAAHDQPAGGKGRPAMNAPAPEPDVERDLEAELLHDLQASFAAIREPFEQVSDQAPPPAEAPAPILPERHAGEAKAPPPPPTPAPPAVGLDLGEALGESAFAPPRAARPEPAGPGTPQAVRPPGLSARADGPEKVPAPPIRPQTASRPQPPRPRVEAPAARAEPPAQPKLERPVLPAAPPERPSLLRRVVGAPRGQAVPLTKPTSEAPKPSRPAEPPTPRAAPPRGVAFEPPPSRFAPARPVRPAPSEPAPEIEPDEPDLDLSDLVGEERPFEEEFSFDELDAAAFAPDDELPPFPEEELAGLKRRRSGRIMAVVAGVLAIVVIGGAVVFLYRSDAATSVPPPIIAADAGPTKVAPEEDPMAVESDPQGKLIYDRVDDGSDPDGTRLVTSDEVPVADIPSDEEQLANNPISRVIIPGGPGVDPPMSEDPGVPDALAEATGADSQPAEQPSLGPRMVRTVVVRPDGTIVSSNATGVDENGEPQAPEPPQELAAAEEPPVASARTQMDAVLEGGDLPVNPDPLGNPAAAAPAPGSEIADASEPIPDPEEGQVAALAPDLPTPEPAAIEPDPAPPANPEPVQPRAASRPQGTIVATPGTPDGPIDLTPGTAPASAAPARSSGGVLVQVSAQRTEEAAISAYRGLQQRYPSILGAYQPRIVRADLGDKGIYYRVRVGPFSGGDAERLCADLKAAGADCLLAR
jgi:hypothetical protein